MQRRTFLRLAGTIAASAALSACQPLVQRLVGSASAPSLQDWSALGGKSAENISNFLALNRMTFGPRPEERLRAAQIGISAWVEEQLAPSRLEDGALNLRLFPLASLDKSAADLADWSSKLFGEYDRLSVPAELRQAALLRQVYSTRQLNEVMVEFWNDHFSVSVDKGDVWYLKTVDDREVIRPHALSSFRDLLWASAHSPAMLVYLDNQSNHSGKPNENYARELMELHTLGIHGGYTQQDVMGLARCLTGWTVKEHFWRGQFTFDGNVHDAYPKQVLGMALAPGEQGEAEAVIERLALHPSTARFIATKLVRRFIADDPPPALVDRAAAAFLSSRGDIPSILRAILLDGGLEQAAPKFKRPLNFITSALRMLNAQSDGGATLQEKLAQMGQAPFSWPTPDGFPDTARPWQGGLMHRWQFGLELARGELPGTSVDFPALLRDAPASTPTDQLDRLSTLLLGEPLPSILTRELALAFEHEAGLDPTDISKGITAGLLASPAFQWR